jgi:hypothetical protein
LAADAQNDTAAILTTRIQDGNCRLAQIHPHEDLKQELLGTGDAELVEVRNTISVRRLSNPLCVGFR